MFSYRVLTKLLIRKYSAGSGASGARFVINKPKKSQKWNNILIFGGSFGTGWYLTQHLTLSDLMAWWLYDSLPDTDPKIRDYRDELNQRCDNLPIVKQLVSKGYVPVYKQTQPSKDNTLIDKTLSVPGAICIPPRMYYNPVSKDTVSIYHLGMKLTGYPFLIHGGILATVLEDMMRDSVKIVTGKKAETTKSLKLSYFFPTLANQFVVVRRTKWEQSGGKVSMEAELLDQQGKRPLVKGKARFKIE